MTSHTRCASCSTLEHDVTHFVQRHADLRPYACSPEKLPQKHRVSAGREVSYWGCQVTHRVGSATRTPDVEARIVWRADQVHTVSPTSSRHRQVVKHDALDLGDKGGQHHIVEICHNTNCAIFDRSTCSLSSSSQLRRTHDVISEEDGRQKSMLCQSCRVFSATADSCPEQ